jgi:hypothetical protein
MKRARCSSNKEEKGKKMEAEKMEANYTKRALPDLVVRTIFGFIGRPLLAVTAQVCRRWTAFSADAFFEHCETLLERDDLRMLWSHDVGRSYTNFPILTLIRHQYVHCVLAWIDRWENIDGKRNETIQMCVWNFHDDAVALRFLEGLRERGLLPTILPHLLKYYQLQRRVQVAKWMWENFYREFYTTTATATTIAEICDDDNDDDKSCVLGLLEFGYRTRDTSILKTMQKLYESPTDLSIFLFEQRRFFWAAVSSGDVAMLEWLESTTTPTRFTVDLLLNGEDRDTEEVYDVDMHDSIASIASQGSLSVLRWVVERSSFSRNLPGVDGVLVFGRACRSPSVDVVQWLHATFPELCHAESVETGFGKACEGSTLKVVQWLVETFSSTVLNRPTVVRILSGLGTIVSVDILRYLIGVFALTERDVRPLMMRVLANWTKYVEPARGVYELAREMRFGDLLELQKHLVMSAFHLMRRRRTEAVDWVFSALGNTPAAPLMKHLEFWITTTITDSDLIFLTSNNPWRPFDNIREEMLREFRWRCRRRACRK